MSRDNGRIATSRDNGRIAMSRDNDRIAMSRDNDRIAMSRDNDRIVSNRVARRRATGFSLFVYIHKYLKTQILRRATEFERTTKIKAFQFKSYDRTMFGLNRP
jgi:hypothetical protein